MLRKKALERIVEKDEKNTSQKKIPFCTNFSTLSTSNFVNEGVTLIYLLCADVFHFDKYNLFSFLPNDKFLDRTKFKAFAEDKSYVV